MAHGHRREHAGLGRSPASVPTVILGLHHVAVGVPDLEAAVDFYVDAFGCEIVFRSHIDGTRADADAVIGIDGVEADAAMLRLGTTNLELWQYREPAQVDMVSPPNALGFPHIAVAVTDIEAEQARLGEVGMTFVGPVVDMGHQKAIYGADPFGNIIELYESVA